MTHEGYATLSVEEVLDVTACMFRLRLEGGAEEWVIKSKVADAGRLAKGDRNVTIQLVEEQR